LAVDKDNGYIIEYDAYWWNEEVSFPGTMSSYHQHYTFKYPDEKDVTSEQLNYITQAVAEMEASVKTEDYPDYIDVSSFAAWLLAHDILGTSDDAGSNKFLTKYDNTPESKFMMGNLWDFDTNFQTEGEWARVHHGTHDSEYVFQSLLLNENPLFREIYIALWESLKDGLQDSITQFFQVLRMDKGDAINKSRLLDNQRWAWYKYHPIEEDIEQAQVWFADRTEWLNKQMESLKSFSTDVQTIPSSDIQSRKIPQEYWNLSGWKMPSNVKRCLLIDSQGHKIIRR